MESTSSSAPRTSDEATPPSAAAPPLAVVVLAAGKGTRVRLPVPKVLLPACGRPLLGWVLGEVAALAPERTVLVVHHGREEVERSLEGLAVPGLRVVDQGEPRGTGHALLAAQAALEGFKGEVLVAYGDCPLITAGTLRALRAARGAAAASVLTARPPDPSGLGRVLRDSSGRLLCVREERDCSAAEREIREVNTGFYCFDPRSLFPALRKVRAENVQQEHYLTDVLGILVEEGCDVRTFQAGDPLETTGVNSLQQLAAARRILQERILLSHMANGVIIDDPATTFVDHDVRIGPGTRILPCTVIASGVRIGPGCEVGPFAHLRAAAELEEGAEVGNFVEVKKSRLGKGAKAKHLAYLGDAEVGDGANIGAGSITANYDGRRKHVTRIGRKAFVGSGTIIVAPAEVGEGAVTGAGSVVLRESVVGAGEVWFGVPARPRGPRRTGQAAPGGQAEERP